MNRDFAVVFHGRALVVVARCAPSLLLLLVALSLLSRVWETIPKSPPRKSGVKSGLAVGMYGKVRVLLDPRTRDRVSKGIRRPLRGRERCGALPPLAFVLSAPRVPTNRSPTRRHSAPEWGAASTYIAWVYKGMAPYGIHPLIQGCLKVGRTTTKSEPHVVGPPRFSG